jgi:hypothetical protein
MRLKNPLKRVSGLGEKAFVFASGGVELIEVHIKAAYIKAVNAERFL